MKCQIERFGKACYGIPYCTFLKRIREDGKWVYRSLICCIDHARNRDRTYDTYIIELYDSEGKLKEFSGENSAYWEWAERECKTSEEGEVFEHPRANPDVLGDNVKTPWQSEELYYEKLELVDKVKANFHIFSHREGQILNLICYKGLSQSETARVLDIKPQTVNSYLKQIRKKITNLLL